VIYDIVMSAFIAVVIGSGFVWLDGRFNSMEKSISDNTYNINKLYRHLIKK